MHRRKFMNVTAGAVTALAFDPLARATGSDQKNPVAYPDPAVEVVDPRFAKYRVISAAVERLYTGTRWAEGPVWFGDGRYLLFSDIPNNRMFVTDFAGSVYSADLDGKNERNLLFAQGNLTGIAYAEI